MMAVPLLIAARAAFVIGKEFYKHRTLAKPVLSGFEEDPRGIVRDAMDPDIPASDVRARARIRSHTGRLLAKVEEKLAERPATGPFEAIGSMFE
jgi:hypothetical protein